MTHLRCVLLRMLRDIEDVCRANRITCLLAGGSCLGAVRHGGFIPWDDDLDLNMTRADYERFVPLFEKKYGDRYCIQIPGKTMGYPLLFSRIRLKGTSLITRDDFRNEERGVFIDLFVIENTFNSRILRVIHGMGCYFWGGIVSCRKFYRDRKELCLMIDAERSPDLYRSYRLKVAIGRFLFFVPLERLISWGDRWYRCCRDNASDYVSVPSGRKYFRGEMHLRRDYCRPREIMFEGEMHSVPYETSTYLNQLYGDYMKIPDPEDRERHIYLKPIHLGD